MHNQELSVNLPSGSRQERLLLDHFKLTIRISSGEAAIRSFYHKQLGKLEGILQWRVTCPSNYDRVMHVTQN